MKYLADGTASTSNLLHPLLIPFTGHRAHASDQKYNAPPSLYQVSLASQPLSTVINSSYYFVQLLFIYTDFIYSSTPDLSF